MIDHFLDQPKRAPHPKRALHSKRATSSRKKFMFHPQIFILILLSILPLPFLFAQNDDNIDENVLFGDDDSVVDAKSLSNDTDLDINKRGVTFGGTIYNRNGYTINRWDDVANDLDDEDIIEAWSNYWKSNFLFSYLQSDLFFDVRIDGGFKAYSSLSVLMFPTAIINSDNSDKDNFAQSFNAIFNELFLDVNIAKAVYFRVGKQFLKWGRGFFWTPSDLFNTDRKSFTDLERTRQGIYGLRIFIPIGTLFNGYFVLLPYTPKLNELENYTYTIKGETLLLDKVELAIAYAKKANNFHAYSLDFSTSLLGWNWYGEGLYTSKHTKPRYHLKKQGEKKASKDNEKYSKDSWAYVILNQGAYQAMLGGNISFQQNKHSFAFELYYNGEGYSDDDIIKQFHKKELILHNQSIPEEKTIRNQIFASDSYHALQHSQWYIACFLTFTELFHNTTTLALNATVNFNDYSSIVSPVLIFSPVNDFFLTLSPSLYLGAEQKEFSFLNLASTVRLDLSLAF